MRKNARHTPDRGIHPSVSPISESFVHFRAGANSEYRFGSNYIHTICEDKQGHLWIGTYLGGFSRVKIQEDADTGLQVEFTQYTHDPGNPNSLSNNIVKTICPDRFGKLWIGTAEGLNRFDPADETFARFFSKPDNSHVLSSSHITSMMEDHSGAIWIGTLTRGLYRIENRDNAVADADITQFRSASSKFSGLSSDRIRCIFEDSRGDLWVGTFRGGLNKFEKQTGTFTVFKYNPFDKQSLNGNSVLSIYEDQSSNLWFGMAKNGVNKLNRNSRHFFNLKIKSPDDPNLNTSIFAIYEDQSGNLWTGGNQGFLHKFELEKLKMPNRNNQNLKSWESIKLSDYLIRAIHMDKLGFLWVGTLGGLFQLNADHFKTGRYRVYRHDSENPQSLPQPRACHPVGMGRARDRVGGGASAVGSSSPGSRPPGPLPRPHQPGKSLHRSAAI